MLAIYLSLIDGGDNKALFTEFHRRYEKKLYAVALHILHSPALAEEAVSEAFLRVANHFEKFLEIFQKSREEIGPWAVTIVKNISLDILKKENRSGALPEEWDAPTPEDLEDQAGYRALVALIRALPEEYREILELKFVGEWTDADIAKKTGLSEGAVAMRVSRGRAVLIEKLREAGYDNER